MKIDKKNWFNFYTVWNLEKDFKFILKIVLQVITFSGT